MTAASRAPAVSSPAHAQRRMETDPARLVRALVRFAQFAATVDVSPGNASLIVAISIRGSRHAR